MPASWTTHRRRKSPDISPQLVSLLCTKHFLLFFLFGACDVSDYEFMWTSADFAPPPQCLQPAKIKLPEGGKCVPPTRGRLPTQPTRYLGAYIFFLNFANNSIGVAPIMFLKGLCFVFDKAERGSFINTFWFVAAGTFKWNKSLAHLVFNTL